MSTAVQTDRLWTTAEAAAYVRMSPEWVREHAAELGGIRISDSPRGPLRFEKARLDEWKERRRLPAPAPRRKPQRPGKRPAPAGVELFPLPAGH